MDYKKKDDLIAWSNMIITGGGLLDISEKINTAKKSSKLYGKFKGNHDKWIYWTKIEIDALPDNHKKHFIEVKSKFTEFYNLARESFSTDIDLANKMEITKGTLWKLKNGKRSPNLKSLEKWAKDLSIEIQFKKLK